MRATMLFPTSFAPLPKARMNNTPTPRSAVRDIGGAHSTLFRRNTFEESCQLEPPERYWRGDTIARALWGWAIVGSYIWRRHSALPLQTLTHAQARVVESDCE